MNRRLFIFFAGLMLAAGPALGNVPPNEAGDKTVIGYWRFDGDAPLVDLVSGGTLTLPQSGVTTVSSGGFQGGALQITTGGAQATGTLGTPRDTYFTYAVRVKRDVNMKKLSEPSQLRYPDEYQFTHNFNDETRWHLVAARYQKGRSSSSDAYGIYCDLTTTSSPRPEISGDSVTMPLEVTGNTVKIGGNVYSSSYPFSGQIDEVMIFNRTLTKNEVIRLYQTGETYIWLTQSNKKGKYAAYAYGGYWSSYESSQYVPKPGDIPGAAYIVDGKYFLYITATDVAESATDDDLKNIRLVTKFGGETNYDKVSLTLGRLSDVVNLVDGNNTVIVSKDARDADGNIDQNNHLYPRCYVYGAAGTDVTINDLRLNCGIMGFTSPDMILRANLTINAASDKPYHFSNNSGQKCRVIGTAKGDGYLKKWGTGELDLSQLVGDYRLIVPVNSGTVRTRHASNADGSHDKQIWSYVSCDTSKIIVDTEGPVVFWDDGEVALGSLSKPRVFLAFETKPSRGRYHILTLPKAFEDSGRGIDLPCKILDTDGSASANIVREGREVYAEFPVGDFGSVPLVIGE